MDNNIAITSPKITNPEKWDLALRIGKDGLDYTLHTTFVDYSMTTGSVTFEKSAEKPLARMENSFYDYPILVDDYRKVSVVFDNDKFIVVPNEFISDNDINTLFRVSFPGFNGDIVSTPLKSCDATLVFGLGRGVESFLRRTYLDVHIKHSLQPLIEFFGRRARMSNGNKMYVSLIKEKAYIIAFNRSKLVVANVLPYRNISDVAYYLLGLWKEVDFDQRTDELQISGDTTQRKELMDTLREFISLVMPSLFPSALLKLNRDALKTPFDLMLLSLCE